MMMNLSKKRVKNGCLRDILYLAETLHWLLTWFVGYFSFRYFHSKPNLIGGAIGRLSANNEAGNG
jgi:hypothetical protein